MSFHTPLVSDMKDVSILMRIVYQLYYLCFLLTIQHKRHFEPVLQVTHKLLIAGEFYASRDKYIELIKSLGIEDEIVLHDHFIPDGEVRNYFSAADCVVLPYKTATQSGVTQIAYNFRTPIIVTNVGGLSEIVPDGRVGYVAESSPEGVLCALERIYEGDTLEQFCEAMTQERKRFSWAAMCDRIEELHTML